MNREDLHDDLIEFGVASIETKGTEEEPPIESDRFPVGVALKE